MAMLLLQHTTSHPGILISTMTQVLPPPEFPRSLVFGRLIGVRQALVSRSRRLTVSFRPSRRRGWRWQGLPFPGAPVANRFGPSPRLLKLRRALLRPWRTRRAPAWFRPSRRKSKLCIVKNVNDEKQQSAAKHHIGLSCDGCHQAPVPSADLAWRPPLPSERPPKGPLPR